jgi:hypothetical protein
MAQLHFENLTNHCPDVLMRNTFYGLKDFFEFLKRSKNYLESEASVKRLAWEPVSFNNKKSLEKQTTGYWVQLVEPKDKPNEPETTFKVFLDDNQKELYDVEQPEHESSNISFYNNAIKILDRNPDNEQILLEKKPHNSNLVIRPNTWPLTCQIRAIQNLQDSPSRAHLPLLRLFESNDHAGWADLFDDAVGKVVNSAKAEALRRDISEWEVSDFIKAYLEENPITVSQWNVLTNKKRPGNEEQREFVDRALLTPDFAFLEGPPGSGKTTAICELILQFAAQGKRVLLCASTHVAVDNVLERLMDENSSFKDQIIPIRIGDHSKVSKKAKKWQLENFLKTEKERLLKELNKCSSRTDSQNELLKQLRSGKDYIEQMVLQASNLVCGTTIGILQHPDIKNKGTSNPQFDVMIIDEASKTTFQEFLVPALLAKRWILVGDPKQLSPYVDDEETAINIRPCLQNKDERNACVDVFMASRPNLKQRKVIVVVSENELLINTYRKQSFERNLTLSDSREDNSWASDIVIDNSKALEKQQNTLPLDIDHIRLEDDRSTLKRRISAYKHLAGDCKDSLPVWENEVSWRLTRLYDLRLNNYESLDQSNRKTTSDKLNKQLKELLPVLNTKDVQSNIDRVRRVALPSVLESLQNGFERNKFQTRGTALTDGLPDGVLKERHVLLSTQHRMHPEISDFSHRHIYGGEAMHSPDFLEEDRQWSYSIYKNRSIWLDVTGKVKSNSNWNEAQKIIEELAKFNQWAKQNPSKDGVWEVAILTFYRGQEREIRKALRKWTKQHSTWRYFHQGAKDKPYINIQLCTVDSFQGQEADLVFLSFTNNHPTSFLESPNRLNVAITRARYQLVVVGNRNAMKKASGILGVFANEANWGKAIEEKYDDE